MHKEIYLLTNLDILNSIDEIKKKISQYIGTSKVNITLIHSLNKDLILSKIPILVFNYHIPKYR